MILFIVCLKYREGWGDFRTKNVRCHIFKFTVALIIPLISFGNHKPKRTRTFKDNLPFKHTGEAFMFCFCHERLYLFHMFHKSSYLDKNKKQNISSLTLVISNIKHNDNSRLLNWYLSFSNYEMCYITNRLLGLFMWSSEKNPGYLTDVNFI